MGPSKRTPPQGPSVLGNRPSLSRTLPRRACLSQYVPPHPRTLPGGVRLSRNDGPCGRGGFCAWSAPHVGAGVGHPSVESPPTPSAGYEAKPRTVPPHRSGGEGSWAAEEYSGRGLNGGGLPACNHEVAQTTHATHVLLHIFNYYTYNNII